MNTSRYFSADYATARHRFRGGVRDRGGQVASLELTARGPLGEDLTIDIGWFGAGHPQRVFVHSSGLHGVEAFAGSGIQWQWLEEGLSSIPTDSAIILVHILNPYGMVWLRRFNESNVDLNRNFREPGEYTPDPVPYWDTVNAFLNPPITPRRDGFYFRAGWLVLRYGLPSLRQAVAGGQCLNPKGLFFGGAALEEGPAKFQEFMMQRLPEAEKIVAIDVHTGLGRFGEDRLLVDSRFEGTSILHAMREAFGQRIELLNQKGIAYSTKGAQQEMYFRSFPRAKIYFATQEFGTYNPLRVASALRAENRFHHYGRGAVNHATKKALLQVFNPENDNWRRSVLTRGREVIHQGLALAFKD